jgi:D-lactate dehydrogenase (cytochrome)
VKAGGRRRECPRVDDPSLIRSAYGRLLKDESNLRGGTPERIFFPESVDDIRAAVLEARETGGRITTSGARTGIVGGAVPSDGDDLISLEGVKGAAVLQGTADGVWTVSIPPSLTLEGLASFLGDAGNLAAAGCPPDLFYPVDPTETTASLGGNAATNASGARSLLFGPTRNWVVGLSVVLSDGSLALLSRGRGEGARRPGTVSIPRQTEKGVSESFELDLPGVSMPEAKHAAGYWMAPEMRALDLFIGSEGTLGIIAGLELALAHRPAATVGVCVFFEDGSEFLELLSRMKNAEGFSPAALEYMDGHSLRLLEEYRREAGEACGFPSFPHGKRGMMYVEAGCPSKESADAALEEISGALERQGIREESTWAAADIRALTAMRKLRHALPERVNAEIARRAAAVPGISKLSTDLSVAEGSFGTMVEEYRRVMTECGLSYVLFGHAGDSHLHLNILPGSVEDMDRGREACICLARRAVELGGSVSAEHGIGKLKKHLLPVQFEPSDLAAMRSVKERLDPQGVLNPGVLW